MNALAFHDFFFREKTEQTYKDGAHSHQHVHRLLSQNSYAEQGEAQDHNADEDQYANETYEYLHFLGISSVHPRRQVLCRNDFIKESMVDMRAAMA